ncbi:Mannuronan C-5-epimerase (Partial), partial [Ectocarpus siliculosus]
MTPPLGTVLFLTCGFSAYSGAQANTPIPKPICDSSKEISVRYSSTSKRIYLESIDGSRGGCASPTMVHEALGDASPLFPLETPGEWMLSESLHVLDGITLNLYGTDVGGDVDYIKLRSDSEMTVSIRAHGGSLDLLNTKVTSWDSSKGDVDTDWSDGRSFLSAISEVVLDTSETCVGSAKNDMGEARMDIENCEIAFLGYEEAESWGISWKLRGVCNDKSNLDMYEGVGVYGNLLGSEVHDLYYGHYGYRQSFALLSRNSVYNNEVYGFDPHDDSVNITISHNDVYFNFNHGVIWSKYCHNAVVTNNHVHDNGGVGIFPHFVSDNAYIAHNTIEKNGDSGIAFLESSGGLVYNNTVRENVHGIRFSVGSRQNVVAENTFEANSGYDLYQYAGSDEVVEVDSGNPTGNVIYANLFSGNVGGARLDDSIDTQLIINSVEDWASIEMVDSMNTLVQGNSFPDDMMYTSSGSCINSASDVSFGEVCTDAAIDPVDRSDHHTYHPTNDPSDTVATESPPDPQTYAPTVSPHASAFTTRPTSQPSAHTLTASPTIIIKNGTESSYRSRGANEGDGDDYDEFETESPTPMTARGIEVDDDRDAQ